MSNLEGWCFENAMLAVVAKNQQNCSLHHVVINKTERKNAIADYSNINSEISSCKPHGAELYEAFCNHSREQMKEKKRWMYCVQIDMVKKSVSVEITGKSVRKIHVVATEPSVGQGYEEEDCLFGG